MGKKAQIQMAETIAVLVIFFFLIVVGMVFYVRFMKQSINEQIDEQRDLDNLKIMKRALGLPELSCSEQNIVRESCVDRFKLMVAKDVLERNELYYYDTLGFSTIIIQELYPGTETYELYNRPMETFSTRSVTNTPISILDPVSGKYSFGLISVVTYAQ